MLSKIIKERIEQRFGQAIRYSKDCEALSASISKQCKANISASTLKRLFGFNQGKQMTRPRLYTLDVLSSYLGFKTWNELVQSLDTNAKPVASVIEHISPDDLKNGESVVLHFNPGIEVILKFVGKDTFEVTESNSKELMIGDVLKLRDILLHYPLFVINLSREGHSMGKIMFGDVSGIVSIQRVKGKTKV